MQTRPLVGLILVACGGTPSTTAPTAPTAPVANTTAPTAPSSSRCTSTPRAIATEQDGPALVAVDATSAFWTNQNGGQVMSALLDGGEPRALAEKQHPYGIAIDATHVYWTNNLAPGSVVRVPKQGGAVEVVADAQSLPYGLSLAAGVLYWVNAGDGSVLRAALDGRDRKILATKQEDLVSIATDGRSVFWLYTRAGVEVRKVSIDGGTPSTLATEHGNPRYLAVDRSRVYWTNQHRGTVMAAPIDGGAMTELVIDEHYPLALAVDEANLYWIDDDGPSSQRRGPPPPKRIRKAPLAGGEAVTLASASDAHGIAVDANCVYWTEARGTTGAVMTVAK